MTEEKKRATCAECGKTAPILSEGVYGFEGSNLRIPAVTLEEHGCIPQEPCAGCGVRGCSARAVHEKVANARRGMSQVERLEVLRRNGIEPPNGHIDSGFMQAIVAALLRLEAQVDGLPAGGVVNVAPRVDAEVDRVREEFARRPAEPRPVIDYRPGTKPPRYKPNVRTRGRCGACEGKGRALFGFRRCGACEGRGYVK